MSIGEAIAFCLTGVCVLIYVPVLLNAGRQIQRGEVILTNVTPLNPQPKRYTGASATVYALAQGLSAVILIGCTMQAFTGNNLLWIPGGFIASMIVGWGGVKWADQLGYEVLEPNMGNVMNLFSHFLSNGTRGRIVEIRTVQNTTPQDDDDPFDDKNIIMDASRRDIPDDVIEDADYRPIERKPSTDAAADTSTPTEPDDTPTDDPKTP